MAQEINKLSKTIKIISGIIAISLTVLFLTSIIVAFLEGEDVIGGNISLKGHIKDVIALGGIILLFVASYNHSSNEKIRIYFIFGAILAIIGFLL